MKGWLARGTWANFPETYPVICILCNLSKGGASYCIFFSLIYSDIRLEKYLNERCGGDVSLAITELA